MINKIKIILILVLLTIVSTKSHSKEKVFIFYNVNDQLITNIDVKKESSYLIALNNQLAGLDEEKILSLSKESVLRETIKKIELDKYFDLGVKNPLVDEYIESFYLRLKLKNEKEFQAYLQSFGLPINFVKKKIQIEITWNRLIYEKFKNELKIDKEKIRKNIESNQDKIQEKVYSLSEIVFEINNQNELKQKKININESIKEIGFKNSANIYSISDSSKFGGDIGWVAEKDLSKKIFDLTKNLKIGEYTNPINTGSSFLILKINDIKYNKKVTNINQEMDKKIQIETDRQLQQYSTIHYNKIKINTNIDEL